MIPPKDTKATQDSSEDLEAPPSLGRSISTPVIKKKLELPPRSKEVSLGSLRHRKKTEKKSLLGKSMMSLMNAFQEFDANMDGKISMDDVVKVMHSRGYRVTEQEASELMNEFDLNSDGVINYEEFVHLKHQELSKKKERTESAAISRPADQLLQGLKVSFQCN